jgi:hypothetical protein
VEVLAARARIVERAALAPAHGLHRIADAHEEEATGQEPPAPEERRPDAERHTRDGAHLAAGGHGPQEEPIRAVREMVVLNRALPAARRPAAVQSFEQMLVEKRLSREAETEELEGHVRGMRQLAEVELRGSRPGDRARAPRDVHRGEPDRRAREASLL